MTAQLLLDQCRHNNPLSKYRIVCYYKAVMKVENRHLSSLFIVLFFFYSISPLSFTFNGDAMAEDGNALSDTPSFSGGVRILFWELICSKFTTDKNSSRPAPAERVLVRKAKALVRTNSDSRLTHSAGSPVPECIFSPDAFFSDRIFVGLYTANPPVSASRLSSGLSPPPA